MATAIDEAQLRTLLEQGVSQREIARQLGIPRSTLQDHLKRLAPVEVHRGTPQVMPRSTPAVMARGLPRPPEVDLPPQTPAELDAIKADLLEVAQWWRARKMRRVDPGGPREAQRQTWHVDTRW